MYVSIEYAAHKFNSISRIAVFQLYHIIAITPGIYNKKQDKQHTTTISSRLNCAHSYICIRNTFDAGSNAQNLNSAELPHTIITLLLEYRLANFERI